MRHRIFWSIVALAIFAAGCGKKSKSSASVGLFPNLDIAIPQSATVEPKSLLVADQNPNVLETWLTRLDKVIVIINDITAKLNSEQVGVGRFKDLGPDRAINGYVKELEDSGYSYQAVICAGQQPFMQIKWSSDGRRLFAVHNFAVNFTGKDTTALIGQIVYDVHSGPTFELRAQGKPFAKPDIVSNNLDYLNEYVQINREADAALTIKGVNDWYAAGSTQFDGDTYVTGKVAPDGSGEYLAYRRFNAARCNATFDENSTTTPAWCLGRNLDATSSMTASERTAAWDRLKSIGIASDAMLATISLDVDLVCELPPTPKETP